MTKEFESEVTEVCNLSRAIEESGIEKGMFITLFRLVDDGDLSIEKAALRANMTVEEFLKMKEEYEK